MRIALLAVVMSCTVFLAGCQHQHLASTQLEFKESVRYVNGMEAPVVISFPSPGNYKIVMELADGSRLEGTLHMYQPSSIANYANIPVDLDFQTLSDLKAYRGTARVVIWEPEEYGEHPYATHLEKGQSPEGLATESGRVLAILDLRRVD